MKTLGSVLKTAGLARAIATVALGFAATASGGDFEWSKMTPESRAEYLLNPRNVRDGRFRERLSSFLATTSSREAFFKYDNSVLLSQDVYRANWLRERILDASIEEGKATKRIVWGDPLTEGGSVRYAFWDTEAEKKYEAAAEALEAAWEARRANAPGVERAFITVVDEKLQAKVLAAKHIAGLDYYPEAIEEYARSFAGAPFETDLRNRFFRNFYRDHVGRIRALADARLVERIFRIGFEKGNETVVHLALDALESGDVPKAGATLKRIARHVLDHRFQANRLRGYVYAKRYDPELFIRAVSALDLRELKSPAGRKWLERFRKELSERPLTLDFATVKDEMNLQLRLLKRLEPKTAEFVFSQALLPHFVDIVHRVREGGVDKYANRERYDFIADLRADRKFKFLDDLEREVYAGGKGGSRALEALQGLRRASCLQVLASAR